MAKILRSGYTTGACAAAGVKAALIFMTSKQLVDSVEITALDGTVLTIPIKSIDTPQSDSLKSIGVEVVKDSGDDPDITNGTSVFTSVKYIDGDEIVFKAGEGIGTVTKSGLSVPVGEPAINPGPQKLIKNVVKEFFSEPVGLEVTISIPAGVELAKRTLNPVLGVEGGLSVIGTTGVLRPMSEEAFKKSLVPQIDVALAAGFDSLIFVPGKIGEVAALKLGLPKEAIVETSNFIGYMLEAAAEREVRNVLLLGHIGKLAKVAAGVFYTHNRIADGRLETIAAYAAAEGLGYKAVKQILNSNTTEEAVRIIDENGFERVYDKIAKRASTRAYRYIFGKVYVGTILIDRENDILGKDKFADEILKYFWSKGQILCNQNNLEMRELL
ncbi:MAG: cobalamin biosynthesis protein CbiD [Selenomonadaceae bacterium]|nr:cobalamin biosynthesis protein CbiD [Selenomonadaceae bacterium]